MTVGALALLALAWAAVDAGAPDGGAAASPAPAGASLGAADSVATPPAPTSTSAARAAARAELFGRAAAGDPGNAAFATDLGFALTKLGRRAEAEAALRAAIEKDPRRFYAYVNLADLLAVLDRVTSTRNEQPHSLPPPPVSRRRSASSRAMADGERDA